LLSVNCTDFHEPNKMKRGMVMDCNKLKNNGFLKKTRSFKGGTFRTLTEDGTTKKINGITFKLFAVI